MARDIDLNINVTSDNKGLNETARGLDHVGDSADNASSSFHKLGDESGHIDANIAKLKNHIRELTTEIDRTGNTDLIKDVKADQSALKKFENLAKMLTPLGEEGGKAFNKGFLSSLGDLGGSLRGAMIPAAIGLAALFSPIIGASVAGAVTGAVGLGGIAGGIFAAAQDPQVKQAAHHFGEDIAHEFALSGKSMVTPVIQSLDILEEGFKNIHLDEFFAKAAPHVTELATALSGLVNEMMPGLNRAMDQLGPIMGVMTEEFPELGAAIGDMIGDMAESKGAVEGLQFVFEFLEGTMRVTGSTVAFLGDAFHGMASFSAGLTGALEDITLHLGALSPLASKVFGDFNNKLEEITGTGPKIIGAWAPIPGKFIEAGDAALDTTSKFSHLAMTVNELGDALNELFDDQMGADRAFLAIAKDTADFTAAVKANGHSISLHTQTGLHNRDMVLGLIQDYENGRDAAIKQGKGTEAATRKFHDQIDALAGLMDDLGFTKKQIDTLLGAYKRLHDAPDIQKNIRINVTTSGQTGALALIGNQGKVAAFAEGGWVQGPAGAPQLAVVHGGEFVLSREMLRGTAGAPAMATGTGGGTGRTAPIVAPAGTLEAAVIGALQKFVRDNYGGDVVVAFGS